MVRVFTNGSEDLSSIPVHNLNSSHRVHLQRWQTLHHFCLYINHHHHVMSLAQISLTLSRHPSLSSIAPSWSSRLHLVSVQSCRI